MSSAEIYEPQYQADTEIFDIGNEARFAELLELERYQPEIGGITYDLICLKSEDPETKEKCIVFKKHERDSALKDTWWVVRYNPQNDKLVEDKVVSVKTEYSEFGDTIFLELLTDVSHHGNYLLTFRVNPNYEPTGHEATRTHVKYHGRGVGPDPELQLDGKYSQRIGYSDTEEAQASENDARIYDFEAELRKRQILGRLAT